MLELKKGFSVPPAGTGRCQATAVAEGMWSPGSMERCCLVLSEVNVLKSLVMVNNDLETSMNQNMVALTFLFAVAAFL